MTRSSSRGRAVFSIRPWISGSSTTPWPGIRRLRGRNGWLSGGTIFRPICSATLIEAAVDEGVVVRPPVRGQYYSAFCDPSGGVADAFTCAICHSEGAEGGEVFLDSLIEIEAPFNPTAACADIAGTLRAYGLSRIEGDRYGASWVVDAFSRQGIEYTASERDRSAIYADCLPLFSSGRARLLDHKRLVTQFAQLERRTTSTGRDKIDHPAGANSHDDLANSVAGAMVLASIGDDVLTTYLRAYGPGGGYDRYIRPYLHPYGV